MPGLIVEDGTGLPDADSYITIDEFKTYAASYGIDISAYDDAKIETSCRVGTMWVDTAYRYKGTKLNAMQALEFPRNGCTDWSGYPVVGVPARVKQATAYMTAQANAGPIYTDVDHGGMIKSEAVGPISVTYMDGAPSQKTYTTANNLLAPYVWETTADAQTSTKGLPRGGPFAGGRVRKDTVFDIGMHDSGGFNPQDADPLQ